jgi:hypothetical protein
MMSRYQTVCHGLWCLYYHVCHVYEVVQYNVCHVYEVTEYNVFHVYEVIEYNVWHVCGEGGKSGGSKFLPLYFNTSFQFAFHKTSITDCGVSIVTSVTVCDVSIVTSVTAWGGGQWVQISALKLQHFLSVHVSQKIHRISYNVTIWIDQDYFSKCWTNNSS